MGHKVESIDGGAVGGYQSILFTPDANAPAAVGGALQPIKGVYRGGSDHRKDGQAAGY
jgi:gamma-glutamyltranspeptidase/glutathione hydrolase